MIPVSVMAVGRGTVSTKIKKHYGKGRPSRFSSVIRPIVFWNITYRCNLDCIHCYINARPTEDPRELGAGDLLRLAGEMREIGIPLIVVSGGEPLASPKFWPLAEDLARNGPKWSLSTNGTLITREVAQRLRELKVSYVGISLDSIREEEHDVFRGVRGAYRATMRGIRNSVEEGLDTGIRMTLTRTSIDEAPRIVDMAREMGVRRISFYLLDSTGRAQGMRGELPTPGQMGRFVEEIIRLSNKYDGDPEILVVRGNFAGILASHLLAETREDFLQYLQMVGAQGDCGRKTVSIYPDGTVRPCQFLEKHIIGNLKTQRLRDILSPENRLLRPFLETHKRLRGPKCSKCPFKAACGGGSRNRALSVTGDFWGDDPLCPIDPQELASRWRVSEEDVLRAIGAAAY